MRCPKSSVMTTRFSGAAVSSRWSSGQPQLHWPQNVAMWIRNPDEVKPGANMPTLGLSGREMNELVAYLESLK